MSIRQLTHNMNIISALADEPNDEYGLSAAVLKAKFDESGNVLKTFVNESLIPDLDEEIGARINEMELQTGNMPTGGTAGQILVKKSASDFDAEYRDPDPTPTAAGIQLSTAAAAQLSVGESTNVEAGLTSLATRVTAAETTHAKKAGFVTGTYEIASADTTEAKAKHINLGGTPRLLILQKIDNPMLQIQGCTILNLPLNTDVRIATIYDSAVATVGTVYVRYTATGFVTRLGAGSAPMVGTISYFAIL